MMEPSSSSSLQPIHTHHKPSKNSTPRPHNQVECTAIYVYTITSFLLLITMQSLTTQKTPNSPPPAPAAAAEAQTSRPSPQNKASQELTYHPLRDPSVPPYRNPNRTWFMSTLTGRAVEGFPEHFVFPSRHPNDRILCVDLRNKSYALASVHDAVPSNATMLRGLTFVADSFYDYENPWHGLNAVAGFFAWMRENHCARPRRFVLFKKGEVVIRRVGGWVWGLMKAAAWENGGGEVAVGRGVACFERAVVMRRGLGGMEGGRRHELFEMLRCKAWRYCGAAARGEEGVVRISLVGREGKRGFKNESGVRGVMERGCGRVGEHCSVRLVHMSNMSFCDQVRTMRNTDILASIHGAQLTNMMFMPKGSSVMEMFPTGWLEGAGVGQFIYKWFASWSEMSYEGAWRDTNGLNCSKPPQQRYQCFLLQKDQKVGVDETFLASWIAKVVENQKTKKASYGLQKKLLPEGSQMTCSCDSMME